MGLVVLVLFGASLHLCGDEAVVRAYPLRSSKVDELVSILKDVLSANAKVTYQPSVGHIIIVGTEQDHKLAADLIAAIGAPSANVRLDVAIRNIGAESSGEASLGGEGEVEISREGTSYKFRMKPSARARSMASDSLSLQTLVIQDGAEGSIFVGQEVPYIDWLYEFGRSAGYIQENFEMRRVGASLVATPRVLPGGLVEVTLTPELTGFVEGRLDRIRYTGVATRVIVADGGSVEIGGFGENSEFYDKFLVGLDRRGAKRKVAISLSVRVQRPTKDIESK